MRAVIMNGPRDIEVGEWEKPVIGPGEVLVEVSAAGICGTDMGIYLGKNPYAIYPNVCGHEIAGTVVDVGQGVTGFQAGELVVVEPFIGCGSCYPCRIGKSNCCTKLQIIGIHLPGGYAEQVKAPATHIHRVPEGMAAGQAVFAEPVAIGIQACRRGQIGSEDRVLVIGCGPIGLAIIDVARARGAEVIATDVLQTRLRAAARLGAEAISADDHLLEAVLERTNGEGMPVVIEATGNPKAMESTVDLVAAGGRIVIVGVVKQGTPITLPGLDFTRKEMTVVGSRASVNCFAEALELLDSGVIRYPRVASYFILWDAPRVFATIVDDPASIHKAVLVMDA